MNEEMLAKLQNAESVEEIISIAKEYGQEVTAEQAQKLLDRLNGPEGDLTDDALEAVTGGGHHRYRQRVVWQSFRQIIREAAPVGPSGMQAGRRALDLRAADAGRGHMARALFYACNEPNVFHLDYGCLYHKFSGIIQGNDREMIKYIISFRN